MATYYWSGTGTWDNSSAANWYLGTGATGGNAPNAPLSTDTAILNAASGAGTCTVASTAVCATVTLTGYTGTLAFGASGKVTVTAASSTTVVTGDVGFTVTGTPLVEIVGSTHNVTVAMGAMTEANSISVTFLSGSGTKTVTGSCRDLIFSFGVTGALIGATRTLYGDLTLASGMTTNSSSLITTFAATSGTQTITTDTVGVQFTITINAPGATVELGSDYTQTVSRVFTLTAGTFTTNNYAWTLGSFTSTGSTTRVLNLGSSLVTVISSGTSAWQCGGATNLTVNAGTSTIFFSGTSAKTFNQGTGLTFYNIKNAGGTASLTITSTCTLNELQADTLPCTFIITSGTTQTLTGFPASGSSATAMFCIIPTAKGTTFTLSKASGTWGATNVYVRDCVFTGGATWTATNSADGGNNTGATILYTGVARYWVGGTGTWDTTSTANWSATDGGASGASAPGPGDYAYFSGTTGTVTLGANVTVSKWEVIGTPTFTFAFGTNKIVCDWLGECFKTAPNMSVTGTPRVDMTYAASAGSVGPDTMRHGTSVATITEANTISVYVTAGTATTGLPTHFRTLDCTGFTGALEAAASRTVYGDWIMHSGMTDSGGNIVTLFRGTSGVQEIYCGGAAFNCPITFSGVGGTFRFMDAFSCATSRTVTLTSGILDANGFNATLGFFASAAAATRTLTMGSGTWTVTGSGASAWTTATTTNLTFNRGTATILFTSASAKTFSGGALTYYNISQGGEGALTVVGSNGFNDIQNAYSATGATSILFTAGTTQTVANFTASGSAAKLLTISSATAATHTLTKTGAGVDVSYLNVSYSIVDASPVWLARNSTNSLNNTNWVFPAADATGVSATGSIGSVSASAVENVSVAATGVSATGSVGTVAVAGKANPALTGVSATGSVGTVAVVGKANLVLTGVSATGSVGTVSVLAVASTSVALTGTSTTGSVGTATANAIENVSLELTGFGSSVSLGDIGLSTGQNISVTSVYARGYVSSVLIWAPIPTSGASGNWVEINT